MSTSFDVPAVADTASRPTSVPGVAGPGSNRLTNGPIQPLLMPLWYGCETQGTERAPALIDAALRERWRARDEARLAARLLPAITIPVREIPDAANGLHQRDYRFMGAIAEAAGRLADEVERAVSEGQLALTIGGDHALAVGSLSGSARAVRCLGQRDQPGRLGVIWIDTHADMNTPATSPSGHIHGLPLASAMGFGPSDLTSLGRGRPAVDPADVCLLGVRDLDVGERRMIHEHGVWARTMEEWDDTGIREGVLAAIDHLRERGVAGVHLSFDVDVIDPVDLPATGTICPGGITSREAARVLRLIRDSSLPVVAADIVEFDPTRDQDDLYLWTTTILAATLLGERQR